MNDRQYDSAYATVISGTYGEDTIGVLRLGEHCIGVKIIDGVWEGEGTIHLTIEQTKALRKALKKALG